VNRSKGLRLGHNIVINIANVAAYYTIKSYVALALLLDSRYKCNVQIGDSCGDRGSCVDPGH
jgi:hypothetical protein